MASWAAVQVDRAKGILGRATPAQKWLVAGLGVALVAAVGIGYYLNRPNWVVLVSQADPKDAAAVVARLQELKVPYQPVGDGYTIEVPKSEEYTAKLALAQAGLPKGSSVGMELFDEPKFGMTDFDRQVNYLRAQQGELERALTRINEVEYANVKLAIPEKSVFIREQQPVKASVLVQPRPGRKLSPEQVTGIINFMAGSVQGLAPANVTVVDQTGRMLSGTDAANAQGLDPEQLKRQDQLQKDVEQRVQTLLEPIFGAGNVIARVNLELNFDTSRVETETVGGSTPKQTDVTREAGKSGGTNSTPPNTTPQNGAPPVYQGQTPTGGDDTWKTKTTTTYEVSNRKEVTVVSPGSVKRITVGIAINRDDLTPEQTKSIKESVAGATGADVASISVAAMPFNPTLPVDLAVQSTPVIKPISLSIGLGAASLLLLVGFVLKRRRGEPELELAGMPAGQPVGQALDVALGLMDGTEAAAAVAGDPGAIPLAAVPTGALGLPITPAQPDGNSPDGLTTQRRLELAMSGKTSRLLVPDGQPVDEDLMAAIDDLIHSSPEACAELLRQWLKGVK